MDVVYKKAREIIAVPGLILSKTLMMRIFSEFEWLPPLKEHTKYLYQRRRTVAMDHHSGAQIMSVYMTY